MFDRKKSSVTRIGIVDDEQSCIDHLTELLLGGDKNIEIIFKANGVEEGKTCLKEYSVDLLFLDVQLKDGIGFDLLPFVDENIRVVFATAFDQFAVRAFEVNALDYLVKPIQSERLERALNMFHDQKKRNQTLLPIKPEDELLMMESQTCSFVYARDIQFIQSDKDYSIVQTADKSHYVRRSMNKWEEMLPATLFLRVHRSYIVNMEMIERIKKDGTGRYQLQLQNSEVPIYSSRRYSSRLKRFQEII